MVFLYLIFFTSFFITGIEIIDMGNIAYLGDVYILWALWFIFVMAHHDKDIGKLFETLWYAEETRLVSFFFLPSSLVLEAYL
jgi:hypothetical protein